MGDRTAFFYGTLMAQEVLYRVCYGTSKVHEHPTLAALADKLSIKPAILRDHCRHRVQWADYPGMIYEKGHSVQGTYVTGLTDGDIYRLDHFEGGEYIRVTVKVMLLDANGGAHGDMLDAETYVFTAGDSRLEKREWDFEEFRQEKLRNWADHSEEYQEVDEAVDMGEDYDPTGGRGIHILRAKKSEEKVTEQEDEDEDEEEEEEKVVLESAV